MTTLAQHKAQVKAKRAAAKAAFIAELGDYYAQSAGQSVVDAFKRGDFVEIHA